MNHSGSPCRGGRSTGGSVWCSGTGARRPARGQREASSKAPDAGIRCSCQERSARRRRRPRLPAAVAFPAAAVRLLPAVPPCCTARLGPTRYAVASLPQRLCPLLLAAHGDKRNHASRSCGGEAAAEARWKSEESSGGARKGSGHRAAHPVSPSPRCSIGLQLAIWGSQQAAKALRRLFASLRALSDRRSSDSSLPRAPAPTARHDASRSKAGQRHGALGWLQLLLLLLLTIHRVYCSGFAGSPPPLPAAVPEGQRLLIASGDPRGQLKVLLTAAVAGRQGSGRGRESGQLQQAAKERGWGVKVDAQVPAAPATAVVWWQVLPWRPRGIHAG